MSIPTQTEMFGIVLSLMADGKEHTRKDLETAALDHLQLTAHEALEKTKSGISVHGSRVRWSVSYLARAQLVDRARRGVYVINDEGRAVLERQLPASEMWTLLNERIAALNPWGSKQSEGEGASDPAVAGGASPKAEAASSPQERIGALADELNADLADELIALIMDRDPAFFERVVVDLLERMGYGHGMVTQRSSDGGIDGLITTDELGFRPICTQAKRYAADNKVGRKTIQEFIGALNGASNGVFITTSSFTDKALEFAEHYPKATLALIDGRRLAELMIKYDLGVTTESVVRIKRVDLDYFEEQ